MPRAFRFAAHRDNEPEQAVSYVNQFTLEKKIHYDRLRRCRAAGAQQSFSPIDGENRVYRALKVRCALPASTSFPKLRTYRSDREMEFVAPPMDNRVAIEITNKFDDALLQFVCRVVAEHGARCFGEKTLDEVEPGTVFGVNPNVKRT